MVLRRGADYLAAGRETAADSPRMFGQAGRVLAASDFDTPVPPVHMFWGERVVDRSVEHTCVDRVQRGS